MLVVLKAPPNLLVADLVQWPLPESLDGGFLRGRPLISAALSTDRIIRATQTNLVIPQHPVTRCDWVPLPCPIQTVGRVEVRDSPTIGRSPADKRGS
jgi:hypothetical protein